MNAILWGKIAQKGRLLFCLILLLFFASGCGSSSGDDPKSCPGDPGCPDPGSNVNMEGTWQGSTNALDEELQTTFTLNQNGNDVGGTLQLTGADGNPIEDNDVNGQVSDSKVTISAFFGLKEGGQVEFSYEGTVSGDIYNGNVKLFRNGTDTNQDGTFSLTKGSPTDNDIPNFNGDWEIFEEQDGDGHYFQYHYTVTIEQNGTRATLSKGNDHMTCNVVEEDLVCQGRFFYEEDELSSSFDSYRLRHDSNNGLTGEASWAITYQGNDYYGRSQLTTTQPVEGSIIIYHNGDSTFSLLNMRQCGSNDWGDNRLPSDQTMEPGDVWFMRDIQQGCYDIRACEETGGSGCANGEDITVTGGESHRIEITPRSFRLNPKSINLERFTGSMTRELKKPDR